ncbi:MAG: hypothetical protein Kow0099_39220 [Candidatus Abyssubacteria bacterium]
MLRQRQRAAPRPGAVPQAFFNYVEGKKAKEKKRVEAHRGVIPLAATCQMSAATRRRYASGIWYGYWFKDTSGI